MAGSRGFACVGGPVDGNVVMLAETAAPGSFWNVEGADGSVHRYQFLHNRFEHAPSEVEAEQASDTWEWHEGTAASR